ncbi:MAG: alpha-galactosidase [Oscillospiraceae bacterium]|nr:alpha-galactosidase [Oscillospiraceae bacterium]
MISHENGLFHLQGEDFSYLFRVMPTGQLEHLHFGARVSAEDAEALACKPHLGWGGSVLYSEGVCLDVLPLEWSGSGRGDYRETPLELNCAATDFTYESHTVMEGEAEMVSGLPQARGCSQTLCVNMTHPGGIRLRLYYCVFGGVLTRRAVLCNNSSESLWLTKLMSFSVDLPGSYEMTTFDGGWIAEMRRSKVAVGAGRVVHESTTGFSSFLHQPGFLLSQPGAGEDHGQVYGFNLVYSGSHYASAQRSLQGLTRVMQGISPDNFCRELAPGEAFEAPEAVLCWSGKGFGGVSEKLHRFVNSHIVPKYWQYRQRPVLYNDWEGCMFDFNENRLIDLAKRAGKLGCELFVLDDGWFGKRNNDLAGLGDYTVNPKKLPGGLKRLADRVNALGMQFGLWFEPEAVNPDSELYRAHPDWALTDGLSPVYGRNELLLDLTKPEVRDYIVENVSRVLDSANITYVKWDMNRHSIALGARAYDYILGLYDVLRRIFGCREHILLESCASGGNRFDLGMLCFSPQIWCSDDTDPIERLTIQDGLSYLYPQSVMGAHVSAAPHAQTLRATPLTTRGNVSFFGVLGYELDLKHLVSVEEKQIGSQIRFYKTYRELFQFGTFRRIEGEDAVCWQVSGEGIHIAGLFHRLVSAAPGYQRLRLRGLRHDRRYVLKSREQSLRVGQFGALVKHVAPVSLDPNGIVLRTADRHYTMPDGTQELTATGSALESGVMLSPRFMGTGFDPKGRNQGDFGSNVYVVREIFQG